MEGKKQNSIFREKSLEAIESPESLNDYLRVTSVGVWLILAVVIALLVGGILWSIFGRINTTKALAVVSHDSETVCYVPYDTLNAVMNGGTLSIGEQNYALSMDAEVSTNIITEETNPHIRVAGSRKEQSFPTEYIPERSLPRACSPFPCCCSKGGQHRVRKGKSPKARGNGHCACPSHHAAGGTGVRCSLPDHGHALLSLLHSP